MLARPLPSPALFTLPVLLAAACTDPNDLHATAATEATETASAGDDPDALPVDPALPAAAYADRGLCPELAVELLPIAPSPLRRVFQVDDALFALDADDRLLTLEGGAWEILWHFDATTRDLWAATPDEILIAVDDWSDASGVHRFAGGAATPMPTQVAPDLRHTLHLRALAGAGAHARWAAGGLTSPTCSDPECDDAAEIPVILRLDDDRWQIVRQGFAGAAVTDLDLVDGVLVAVTDAALVRLEGDRWYDAPANLWDAPRVHAAAPDDLYVAQIGGPGLFRSDGAAFTWLPSRYSAWTALAGRGPIVWFSGHDRATGGEALYRFDGRRAAAVLDTSPTPTIDLQAIPRGALALGADGRLRRLLCPADGPA